jgi:hypothetical protein
MDAELKAAALRVELSAIRFRLASHRLLLALAPIPTGTCSPAGRPVARMEDGGGLPVTSRRKPGCRCLPSSPALHRARTVPFVRSRSESRPV